MSDDTDEEYIIENQQIVQISAERHIRTIREGLNIEADYPKISDDKDEDIDVENQQIKQISADNLHITEDGIAMEDESEESVSEDFQDSADSEDSHEPKVNYAVYNNKVILGSKPTSENQSNSQPRSFGRLHIEESYRDGESVLIFGRKPVNQTEEIKTQTPASRNTAVKTTGSNSDLIGNEGKLCHHCDKTFSDITLLVQHLYEELNTESAENPPDLSKCNEKPAVADNPGGLKAYVDTVKDHSSSLETINLDPDPSEKKFYQCSKCGIFVHPKYIRKFIQHMLENHGINKPSTVLVPYNSNCKFCDSVITSHRNFNWHIRNFHENIFLDNPNKSVTLYNEVFLTHKLAMDHRQNKHSEMRGVHILREITDLSTEVSRPATTVDKKVSNTDVTETYKKTKPADYKLIINYCRKCKCCMIDQSRSIKAHRTGQCVREYIERNRTICKSCGLLFNSHGTCPTRDMGLKISEIKFVRIEDQRIINPPIPKYNKCRKCAVNMRRPKRRDPHDCYGVKKTCIYCKEQFSDIIYHPHVALHVSTKAEMNVENGTSVLLKLLTKDKKDYEGEPTETHKSNFLSKENDTTKDDSSDDYNRDKEKEPPEIQNIIKKQEGELMPKRSHESDNEVPKKKENLVILYELWKCADGLHFTSKDAAETHASRHYTGNKESSEKCSQCGLLFDTSQLFKHLCKHHRNNQNVSFDVITVSPISYNDSENDGSNGNPKDTESLKIKKRKTNAKRLMKIRNQKIKAQTSVKGKLYNCRGCNVNFMASSGLYMHVKDNSAPDPVTCEECGLIFSKKGILAHKRYHHDKLRLTREDMNICKTSKCRGYQFVTDAVSAMDWQSKKAQMSEKGKLYNCRGCNVNFMASSGLYMHVKENSAPDPVTCEECGLIFSKKGILAHKRFHHDKLQLTREDIYICGTSKCRGYQFVTVAVSAMDWQTKNVYRCDECSIHFSSYRGLRCHLDKLVHDESTTKCSLCKHVFSFPDFKRHVRINHRRTGVSIKELDVIGSKTLYKCARCEAHYVKEQSLDIHLIKSEHFCSMVHCPHCGLVFTETALLFHKSIHHPTKQAIKDFRIIVKSVANKGNASVENKKQSAQPVKKYRKLRTLYKCFECKAHFLNFDTLRLHHHTVKVLKQRRKCPYCDLLFTPRTLARHTLVHHIKLKCKLEDFHILKPTGIRKNTSRKVVEHTEDDNLQTLNELDKEIDVSTSESTSDIATIHIEKRFLKKITLTNIRCVDGKYNSNRVLYKCTDCQLHFITKNALEWHISYTDHSASENMVHCQDCGLGFTKKSLTRHKKLHHEKNKLSLKDFKIATYLVNSDSNIEVLNGDKNDTRQSKDSDDELNKDSELREQDTSFPISNNYNNNLYRCDTCCIHFIDPDSLRKHKQNKKHATLKYNCTICDLDFDLVNLSTHIDIHHQKLSLNAEDFNIVSDNNESMDVDTVQGTEGSIVSLHRRPEAIADSIPNRTFQRQEERRYKLYKCADCDVYFMAQATCYRHVLNHERMDPKEYIKCKICGLQFKIASLNTHMNRHHKTEGFRIEDVLIEEFDPANSSKSTILNKVQSRLVSTTTGKDEDVYTSF